MILPRITHKSISCFQRLHLIKQRSQYSRISFFIIISLRFVLSIFVIYVVRQTLCHQPSLIIELDMQIKTFFRGVFFVLFLITRMKWRHFYNLTFNKLFGQLMDVKFGIWLRR